ncbi:ROK family protein [Mucilaginibacter sp. E4BP6]|uniref:ROK family protein n=1 Tax=Mucilaginibacter sp. E4BP6 TaxID=2723089 RepID=UPI0015CDA8A6|nr:ROK family protein [Mucilaginibacter sp. E4BP6]NYE64798.1 polyphosphate glucokinase [Mucilaginibacter sp. E4BP6]
MKNTSSLAKILSIDIGGSHIKATILNTKGELQKAYDKVVTPTPANPANVVASIKKLVSAFPDYDHVSVGFPGYVRDGVIKTAPNLGTEDWKDVDFAERLTQELGKPTKVVNDADMQGLGVVSGKGFEMVLTLGTGFGTALLMNGHLLPHLEVAHHPISKKETYDEYIGEKALERDGKKKWNKRMEKVFEVLKTVFNYDTLYIGGGNADKLNFKLDDNMKIVTNEDGIKGGSRLWTVEHDPQTANPSA